MAHPLEQKIAAVRRQARRLLLWHAVAWIALALVVAVLAMGLADYLVRFQDRGIRLMCSLAVAAAVAWACYRVNPLRWRRLLSDVQIAQRIERRFPALADKLSSAIEFLRQPETDPRAGSAALRRAVIIETASQVDQLDVSDVFERRPTRRALRMACAAMAVAIAIAILAPQSARLAVARLLRPFGDDAWPRYYSVEFRETPTRLAAGQPFEVELVNDARHRLPEMVRIHYRYESDSGAGEEEVEPMHLLDGTMVARKDGVTRPFWYRAEGGDDYSMGWTRLEVLEPPRLDALEGSLYPPAYGGLPVEPFEKSIHALRGTRVALDGVSTKKLRSARVVQENGREIEAQIASDGYGFSLSADAGEPFTVDRSGPYWIELRDSEGLVGGTDDRWEIRAVADQPPSVTIEQPAANVFVTPEADLPLKISAKDDLAIAKIGLAFSRSDQTDVEDFSLSLYAGPAAAPAQQAGGALGSGALGESQSVEHRWNLAALKFKPGTQITFWATAGDYSPQEGKSAVRKLSIITPQELEERLAQRETLIFGELQRVLKMQQDARAQTKGLQIQLDHVGRLGKQDVDNAQSAELNQRQITRTLTSPTEGIPAQIADLLADLENNRVDNPDMRRHASAMADELSRLHEQHLAEIERELTSVVKAAQAKLPTDDGKPAADSAAPDPLLARSLSAAGENQDQVIASLENMLGEFGQRDNYRRFARDVAQLERNQQELANATKELGQKTLSRELKDLDAQQQADLKKLSAGQVELGRRLEKLQQQMSQMAASLKPRDPLSAATVSDALHHAQQQGTSGKMREASEQLDRNQIGQAAARHAKIVKDLDEMKSILSNRREQELSRLVQQLRDAEQEMSRLRAEQAGLSSQMAAAREQTKDAKEQQRRLERLAREQKKLEDETARLARRLERLQAERAGQTTSNAAADMNRSGSAGQRGDAAAAEEQAERAEKDLEEAQQQLAQRRRQAEEDLANEQLSRMDDALKSLLERQTKMIAETKSLDQQRAEKPLSRAQRSTLAALARQQAAMQEETRAMAEKLAAAEVLHLAVDGAAANMGHAAELLTRQETGAKTQRAQQSARRRFEQLLSALEKPKNNQGNDGGGEEGSGGGGSGSSQSGQDLTQVLAQLKLLKLLQEELNARYTESAESAGESRAEVESLSEIAAEQGKLAELALKLAQPPPDNPEDSPENLPDVRDDAVPNAAGEDGPPKAENGGF